MFADLAVWVHGLTTPGYAVTLAVLSVATLAACWAIWRNLHRARIIEDMPTARIRSAHQGYVELEGEGLLLDGPAIVAPLTGTVCLWYRYKIERRRVDHDSRGNSHSHWETIRSETSDEVFCLEDPTGRCLVDPDGAEVIADEKDVWYGHHDFPSTGPERKGRGRFHLANGDRRYTEERLMPGHMYALGWFESIRSADGELGTEVTALLREMKQDHDRLLRNFDANGDGHIDANEWEQARHAATQQVIRERAHKASEPARNLMRKPPHSDKPFILSGRPQAFLPRRYRRRALLGLVGTCLGVAALLFVVSVRLSQ